MKKYNPKTIEAKWRKLWQEQEVYKADLDSKKPKYIAMSMFNYPSGAGIHIGHAMNYTISDVLARFKRQQGFESYHPVGWDSFGLPAENYAIKAGVSPQQSMAKIIPNYQKQYRAMGWSNDWSKEIASHEPEYYKWTQWIFSEMYRAGLAYQDTRLQWWCDKCQTVLANEQIINGKCWRHDSPSDPEVTQREVKQWFFKITEYADELLGATDALDWTETVKTAQKNWIGRSEGATIRFSVEGLGDTNDQLEVFTTAHDTIYGVTFMVIAPEHPIVRRYAQLADNAVEIQEYVEKVLRRSEVDRVASKHKTGVPIEGMWAIHPLTGKKLPMWIADYVLAGYGSGAVMAVPGEDERDYEFAQKYNLPIIYTTQQQEFVSYSEAIKQNRKEYILANSGEFDGLDFEIGRGRILEVLQQRGVGEPVVQYKMRDWSVSRQRYWGAPIPIIYCEDHGPVLVPDKDLPVVLPELDNYQPSGDGRSALARAENWVKAPCPTCGKTGERETDTLDTYICSSWYFLRYLDPHNDKEPFDKLTVNKWMPIDFYNGADHATAHMIYARFVARFFHKKGLVANPEPFKKFLFNGKVTASDGQMFSKSKGNGVDPLEIIEQYGVDALRLYLMFAAPLEVWIRWDPQGVPGTLRFLNRIWTLVHEYIQAGEMPSAENLAVAKVTHKTIKKVTADLENLKYNTAIASMMEMLNALSAEKSKNGFQGKSEWKFAVESLVQMIAPFAPHIADELWEVLGHTDSVQKNHWPKFDESMAKDELVTVVVQINGKVKDKISVPMGLSETETKEQVLKLEKIKSALAGAEIKRTVFVQDKLINLVAE